MSPGHRGRGAGGGRAGAPRACWPSCWRSRWSGWRRPATELAEGYGEAGRGFVLARIAGGYRYQTHPDLAPYVERFANREVSHRLSTAALETLAIVAYRQPVSRAQISALRGVNVDGVVRLLEQRGYIEAVGRAEGPGQPVLYGTTDLFLERLGLDRPRAAPPGRGLPARARGGRGAGGRLPGSPSGPVPETPTEPSAEGERLQKVLARAGFGSRRACEDLIAEGRVTVNGVAAVLGQRVDAHRPGWRSTACPVPVRPRPRPLPAEQAGRRGDHGRRTPRAARPWSSLVPDRAPGLLGRPPRLGQRGPAHPDQRRRAGPAASPPVPRRRQGVPGRGGRGARGRAPCARLRQGVELEDGIDRPGPGRAWWPPGCCGSSIHEGRNRQVRRMCEAVGHPVRRLVRTRIGPLSRPATWPRGSGGRSRPAEVRALADRRPDRGRGRDRSDGPPRAAAVACTRRCPRPRPSAPCAGPPPSTQDTTERGHRAGPGAPGPGHGAQRAGRGRRHQHLVHGHGRRGLDVPGHRGPGHRLRGGAPAVRGRDRRARGHAAVHPRAPPRPPPRPARDELRHVYLHGAQGLRDDLPG